MNEAQPTHLENPMTVPRLIRARGVGILPAASAFLSLVFSGCGGERAAPVTGLSDGTAIRPGGWLAVLRQPQIAPHRERAVSPFASDLATPVEIARFDCDLPSPVQIAASITPRNAHEWVLAKPAARSLPSCSS